MISRLQAFALTSTSCHFSERETICNVRVSYAHHPLEALHNLPGVLILRRKSQEILIYINVNVLKPIGNFTYHQVVLTFHLCVLYGSQNKYHILPYAGIKDRFL